MERSLYQMRLDRIQREMESRNIDGIFIYGWKRGQIKYFSGYYPNYIANTAALFIPKTGDGCMWIRFPFDIERAKRESWISDIRASGGISEIGNDFIDEVRGRGLVKSRLGFITGDFLMDEIPYSLFSYIRDELPQVKWENMIPEYDRLRIVKEPSEFDVIRASAKLADLGADKAAMLVKPDIGEYEIVAEVENVLRKNGAQDSLVVIASDGARELISPPAYERKLEEGKNVIIEIAVKYKGYWTQVARTYAVKPITEEQEKIYQAVYRAYEMAAKSLSPGICTNDIASNLISDFSRKGFGDSIEQDFGHGIGLDLPEKPKLTLHDSTTLAIGMAIVVHPAIRIKNVGGAFVGGTVLVTEEGPELLHKIPKELPR